MSQAYTSNIFPTFCFMAACNKIHRILRSKVFSLDTKTSRAKVSKCRHFFIIGYLSSRFDIVKFISIQQNRHGLH